MVNINSIVSSVDTFIESRIDLIIGNNPLMSLVQPFIKRAVKQQVSEYTSDIKKYLKLIADKDGNIDIDNVFTEVTERFNTMDVMTVQTQNMGDILVGKGKVTVEIPSLFGGKSKNVSFTAEDISDFKNMIIDKNASNQY